LSSHFIYIIEVTRQLDTENSIFIQNTMTVVSVGSFWSRNWTPYVKLLTLTTKAVIKQCKYSC